MKTMKIVYCIFLNLFLYCGDCRNIARAKRQVPYVYDPFNAPREFSSGVADSNSDLVDSRASDARNPSQVPSGVDPRDRASIAALPNFGTALTREEVRDIAGITNVNPFLFANQMDRRTFNQQPITADKSPRQQSQINALNPFGNAYGDLDVGTNSGLEVFGSGYDTGDNFHMGSDGIATNKGTSIKGVGNGWYEEGESFGYKPESLANHNFRDQNKTLAYNTGYVKGVDGQAGINGIDIHSGDQVPVLGQKTYQKQNRTRLAIDRLAFSHGEDLTAGPFDFEETPVGFGCPTCGMLIQRDVWDDLFRNATNDKLGIPGGVWAGAHLENVPFAGKK